MIKITNLHKHYPHQDLPALVDINLTIKAGEFCIILGGNGSGKSTLLRLIAGDEQPDQGKCVVTNKRRLSFVTQDVSASVVPELTVLENMVLVLIQATGASLHQYTARYYQPVYQQLATIGFERFIERPMAHLSGGQRQLLATAMALWSRPTLLLLDEHTSALDPKRQETLMEYTAEQIRQQKLTTLMITHNLQDALNYGNRLIVLDHGRVTHDIDNQHKQKMTVADLRALFATQLL